MGWRLGRKGGRGGKWALASMVLSALKSYVDARAGRQGRTASHAGGYGRAYRDHRPQAGYRPDRRQGLLVRVLEFALRRLRR